MKKSCVDMWIHEEDNMIFLINRLDNLDIGNKNFEFISANIKKEMNINGMIVGANGKFLIDQKDIMILIRKSDLRNQIGENIYNAVLRKPMMVFLIPTQEDEFEMTKEELDQRYGIKQLHLNNFAQAFSLGCWFIKDSCVTANFIYWINMFNGYNSQATRDMSITMSNGLYAEGNKCFFKSNFTEKGFVDFNCVESSITKKSLRGDKRMLLKEINQNRKQGF